MVKTKNLSTNSSKAVQQIIKECKKLSKTLELLLQAKKTKLEARKSIADMLIAIDDFAIGFNLAETRKVYKIKKEHSRRKNNTRGEK